MTDFKPQYQSDRLEIFEWPQPICELRDPNTGQIVTIRTPEDATAVSRSLKQFLSITNPKVNQMTEQQETAELKSIADGSIQSIVVVQLEELLHPYESLEQKDDAADLIGKTLEIIQDQFYLVPKAYMSAETQEVATREAPEGTIDYQLAQLWAQV